MSTQKINLSVSLSRDAVVFVEELARKKRLKTGKNVSRSEVVEEIIVNCLKNEHAENNRVSTNEIIGSRLALGL